MEARRKERLRTIWDKWQLFWNSPKGKLLSKALRYVFLLGVLGYLSYQLWEIGLVKILKSLPTAPLFYVLYVLHYFLLPISELFIYRLFWSFGLLEGIKAFITKKVLNLEVVQYSGEIYLFQWATTQTQRGRMEIAGVVKDNNIISSLTSTVSAILLLSYFLYFTEIDLLQRLQLSRTHLTIIYGGLGLLLLGLYLMRKRIFHISGRQTIGLYAIHQLRFFIAYLLEVATWYVVMPEVPFSAWLTILSIKIVLNRLPIPQMELTFIGIVLGLCETLGIPAPEMAALSTTKFILDKVMATALFALLNVDKIAAKQPKAPNDGGIPTQP